MTQMQTHSAFAGGSPKTLATPQLMATGGSPVATMSRAGYSHGAIDGCVSLVMRTWPHYTPRMIADLIGVRETAIKRSIKRVRGAK